MTTTTDTRTPVDLAKIREAARLIQRDMADDIAEVRATNYTVTSIDYVNICAAIAALAHMVDALAEQRNG